MRRLLLLTILTAAAFSLITATALAAEMNLIYDEVYHYYNEDDVFLEINGTPIETEEMPPVVIKDKTLVPVREVFEALGADVSWLNDTQQTKITYNGSEVLFTVGSPVVYMGRSKYAIPETDPAPMIINDKTMVPIRIVATLLGFDVNWDKSRRTVMLTDEDYTPPAQDSPSESVSGSTGSVSKPENKPTGNTGSTSKPENKPTGNTDSNSGESVISKIFCTKSADGADLIYLAYTNPTNPVIARYESPNRVVMDFDGAVFTADASVDFDGTFVKSVRGANHDDKSRIVLDIKSTQPNIELMRSSTGIVIIVRMAVLKPSTKIGDLVNGQIYVAPKLSEVDSSSENTVPDSSENNSSSGSDRVDLDTSGTVDTTTNRSFDFSSIIIDPGHGGHDSGALGGSIKESNVNLAISLKVAEKLQNAGYNVIMTRSGDTYPTLQDRVDIASEKTNGTIPAIFVSIHCNSFENPSTNGTQVYYHPDSKYGTILAQNIYNANVAQTSLRPAQIHDGSHLFVIRKTLQPAALVETGFISNYSDREYISSSAGQEALANGIFTGIVQTLEQMKADKGL